MRVTKSVIDTITERLRRFGAQCCNEIKVRFEDIKNQDRKNIKIKADINKACADINQMIKTISKTKD